MNKSAINISFLSMALLLVSCLEPYEFRTESYEQVLVIDGLLTNETKSHEVLLSYTYPLDSGAASATLDGAQVYVEDSDGTTTNFYNEGRGIYQSISNFRAEEGKEYRLYVITPDNKTYVSSFESMTISPPIDSIYDRYVEMPNELTNQLEPGIQFFLDTHDDTNGARFFRYNYEETYKISVPFPSLFIVEEGVINPRIQQVGQCFEYGKSSNIIVGTSASNSQNRLAELPIRFIFQSSQQLRTRYSILVKQYAISESAYLYYRKLKENNESTGSLFDKQSGTVVGNFSSINDQNEPVLGFFEVSGVSKQRAFFKPNEFDEKFKKAQFRYRCSYQNAVVLDRTDAINHINSTFNNEIFNIIQAPAPDQADSVYIFTNTCTNCSWYADTTVPSYWIE